MEGSLIELNRGAKKLTLLDSVKLEAKITSILANSKRKNKLLHCIRRFTSIRLTL